MQFNDFYYQIYLVTMTLVAVIVFVSLLFVEAGYGKFVSKKWGHGISNKTGWMLMEMPVFISMVLLWWFSEKTFETVPLIIFIMFQIHYFHRSFVFPFRLKGSNIMPLTIVLMGFTFNVLNAFMQGGWIFYLAPAEVFEISWLYSWQFILGTLVYFTGMIINISSDNIIRKLRKPGDNKYYLPEGGMFRYVVSANYFGELLEWIGFALLSWSWAGVVFVLWSFANLAPRARSTYKKYELLFGEEFTKRKLRYIIPFVY
ncbi:MAG TPA: DUF1295 domain-containing protein [Bacteroidales bacterium]|nr:DUF1295 domain-containing protein [Bacteroidales bacterium]